MRSFAVIFHRYVGLAMAIFLAIAGLTGSLLAWNHELDAAINPAWFTVDPAEKSVRLDPLVLRERVASAYPGAGVNYVELHGRPQDSVVFYLEPKREGYPALSVDQVFVDPYSGEILGARRWGAILEGWHNLMPFIYRLHYALALDDFGVLVMGVIALLWTIDCFAGAYLTFPAPVRKVSPPPRPWLTRWRPAWTIRWSGGSYKVNYDLHRAGGLWPWLMLLILAWSSVAFNLHKEIYHPVMSRLFEMQTRIDQLPPRDIDHGKALMSWDEALRTGQALMDDLARNEGFMVISPEAMQFRPDQAVYRYKVRSSLDIRDRSGNTDVVFDARNGTLLTSYLPTGKASGDTITTWITMLHMGFIWGIPFRIFLTILGIATAMLSVTGVYIWWKKRKGRQASLIRKRTDAYASTVSDPAGPAREG